MNTLLQLLTRVFSFWNPSFLVEEQIRFLAKLIHLLTVNVSNFLVVKLGPLLSLSSSFVLNLNEAVIVSSTCAVAGVYYHAEQLVAVLLRVII